MYDPDTHRDPEIQPFPGNRLRVCFPGLEYPDSRRKRRGTEGICDDKELELKMCKIKVTLCMTKSDG